MNEVTNNKTITNNISFKIDKTSTLENGANYEITAKIPLDIGWIDYLDLIVEKGNDTHIFNIPHQQNENGYAVFKTNIYMDTRAIYHYYFKYQVNNQIKYIKNTHTRENTPPLEDDTITKDEMYKMSVNFSAPDWAKGKIMYHIFVDRFNRASKEPLKPMPRRTVYNNWDEEMTIGPNQEGIWNADFYGGDLLGIIEKLDYLKSLKVDIIYLSPVVHSQSNHRYDAADFENVDPYAGCNEDLKLLCDKAHQKGMKVILDAVFNHTGNDSKYFNQYNTFDTIGAYQSIYSTYSPFYKKHYYNGQVYYEYWWNMPNLPVCNGHSSEWQNYILGENGIIDQWFNLGIDGLRLDVADELTDEFIEGIRKAVKRNKEDGFILGEVWKNPMRMNRGYIESGKGMDSVMNYQLMDALIRYYKYSDVNKLSYIIKDIQREYPDDTINTLMNFTSTHDVTRAINIFSTYDFNEYGEWVWHLQRNDLDWCKNFKLTKDQYQYGKQVYKSYLFALTFLPGILSIFYGDEIALEGIGNLANRKPYPWNKENIDTDLLNYFKYLGIIRKEEPFMASANLNILDINNNYFMFERYTDKEKALTTVSRTQEELEFPLPKEYKNKTKVYTLNQSKPGYLSPYGGITIKK